MLEQFFRALSDFTAAQPPALQWLAVFVGGALPFVESYYGAVIGVIVGVHPIAAILCAIAGNIASTTGCIAVASATHARRLRRAAEGFRRAAPGVPGSGDGAADVSEVAAAGTDVPQVKALTKGLKTPKLRRRFEKYGVPGVCLGSQTIMPSQITAVMLMGLGASTCDVTRWQCLSITIWGIAYGSLAALGMGLLT